MTTSWSTVYLQRDTLAWCNVFYRFVLGNFFFHVAWRIWKENHKLAEQRVSLACNVALQPTHMLKRNGFKWLHVSDWMIYCGWNTYPAMDTCSSFCIQRDLEGKKKICSNSSKSSRSSLSTAFLSYLLERHTVAVSVVPALWCCLKVRGHCVCMMCVLAQTKHFHRTSVVGESRIKRKAGGERKHFSGSNEWTCWVWHLTVAAFKDFFTVTWQEVGWLKIDQLWLRSLSLFFVT